MEALLKAPPKKVLSRPKIGLAASDTNLSGSTPGNTTHEPNLKMIKKPRVLRILTLRSSIEKMFLMVLKNFFIG